MGHLVRYSVRIFCNILYVPFSVTFYLVSFVDIKNAKKIVLRRILQKIPIQ